MTFLSCGGNKIRGHQSVANKNIFTDQELNSSTVEGRILLAMHHDVHFWCRHFKRSSKLSPSTPNSAASRSKLPVTSLDKPHHTTWSTSANSMLGFQPDSCFSLGAASNREWHAWTKQIQHMCSLEAELDQTHCQGLIRRSDANLASIQNLTNFLHGQSIACICLETPGSKNLASSSHSFLYFQSPLPIK